MNYQIPLEKHRHTPQSHWTYEMLDRRQQQLAAGVRAGERGVLLLSEVAPVITLGRRATAGELRSPQVPVYPVTRGGLATYHGPGQWVLFAVDRLEVLTRDSRGVRRVVDGLLEVALSVGKLYEPLAEIRTGAELGVWTPRGKFAAVGVRIADGVLQHGLAVNVRRTPESFMGLRPCGLDAPVDFLAENSADEVAADAEFEQVGALLVKRVFELFWP